MTDPGSQLNHQPTVNRNIYVFDVDAVRAQEVLDQIDQYGYDVRWYQDLGSLKGAIEQAFPVAIIIDAEFQEGHVSDSIGVTEFCKSLTPTPSIFFVSGNDNIHSRLQAVRSKGVAYFTRPVDIGLVVDTIERMVGHETQTPYRILLVDDSLFEATRHALILRKEGMETEIITDAMQVMTQLPEFNPDLILLDVYMPNMTGVELARVIRQIEKYIHIPIVFLSGETDKDKQLQAMGIGGDDFLSKPIKPEHLIAAVAHRVERYRNLRSLMLRDSLTGLFNHTTLKNRLNQELSRALRLEKPLTFGMIDLDKFKSVNDTYGHPAGDRVLKSLANMLQQRLRKTDTIGRYGGEEFGVILPDTGLTAAADLMDRIRLSFAAIHHRAEDKEFSVTLSCGLAGYPGFKEVAALSDAADKMLYQAKQEGRNRVIMAS